MYLDIINSVRRTPAFISPQDLWVELVHELGRAESDTDGRVLRLQDRWPEAETRPSPSHTWSAEDRWVRGLAEWDEVEQERRRETGAAPL